MSLILSGRWGLSPLPERERSLGLDPLLVLERGRDLGPPIE